MYGNTYAYAYASIFICLYIFGILELFLLNIYKQSDSAY